MSYWMDHLVNEQRLQDLHREAENERQAKRHRQPQAARGTALQRGVMVAVGKTLVQIGEALQTDAAPAHRLSRES